MRTAFTSILLTGALALALPASAGSLTQSLQVNGSGACQAALPNYEGQIRKRPLAIQNEGTSLAFVTCSPTSVQFRDMHAFGQSVYLANDSAVDVTVSCTGVMGGGAGNDPPEYSTKSVTLPAGTVAGISWSTADLPDYAPRSGTPFNTSCTLAPGVGVRTLYVHQLMS
ncbi:MULTISPECIES: hypothetical protein [unclassified Luteimonas]